MSLVRLGRPNFAPLGKSMEGPMSTAMPENQLIGGKVTAISALFSPIARSARSAAGKNRRPLGSDCMRYIRHVMLVEAKLKLEYGYPSLTSFA